MSARPSDRFPPDLIPELTRRIWAWDPIGVADDPGPVDEYDAFVVSIAGWLADGATPIGLTARITNLVHDRFGSGDAPAATTRPSAFASELVAWYHEQMADRA